MAEAEADMLAEEDIVVVDFPEAVAFVEAV